MNNAKKFQQIFGIYATELWLMTEKDFLKWLNAEYVGDTESYRSGERAMFDLITSAEYGKQCYFDQDDGSIYSRKTCRYLSNLDEALDDWLGEV